MNTGGQKLQNRKTYVLIDASNIRAACLKSCGFNLDPIKLISYLKTKYSNLQEVRYYEGIARDDKTKLATFNELEKHGYITKSIQRRTYIDKAIMKKYACSNCGHQNRVEAMKKTTKMKSNVDVFLASEMLELAYEAKHPIHIVIMSCDGDYAEAIKIAAKNPNLAVTVIATPTTHNRAKNSLSIRLKDLRKQLPKQYHLNNIEAIKDSIKVS